MILMMYMNNLTPRIMVSGRVVILYWPLSILILAHCGSGVLDRSPESGVPL